jgi:hypothetical protein
MPGVEAWKRLGGQLTALHVVTQVPPLALGFRTAASPGSTQLLLAMNQPASVDAPAATGLDRAGSHAPGLK